MPWVATENRKKYWESMKGKSHGHKTSNGGGWKWKETANRKIGGAVSEKSQQNLIYRLPKGNIPWNKGIGGNRASWEAKRNALKKSTIDETTDFSIIEQFYILAEEMTEKTGVKYSVDHIIPISKGGKHHQDNLQVVTLLENLRKKDKYPFEISESYKPNLTKL